MYIYNIYIFVFIARDPSRECELERDTLRGEETPVRNEESPGECAIWSPDMFPLLARGSRTIFGSHSRCTLVLMIEKK